MYINKLGSRSYGYIYQKSFHICVIHFVLEKCCFEVVLLKRRLDPLGVKTPEKYLSPSLQTEDLVLYIGTVCRNLSGLP